MLTARDQERIEAELEALRRAGVRIAIDDFGTGYSSLGYLHRVPVDLIKLDKSFMDTITTSPPQYDLVTGIIGLAHALRLAVVVEGIETAADRDLLVDARCEYGQGYLFGRPMPADDARVAHLSPSADMTTSATSSAVASGRSTKRSPTSTDSSSAR